MAFGSQAKKKPLQNTTTNTSADTIFLDMKQGVREFRIFPNVSEVRFKRLFFAQEGNAYVPTFGFDPNDRRTKKPITIAVFDGALNDGDGGWVYGGDYNSNPVTRYVDSLDLPDETKRKMYAPEVFALNVLDRSWVKIKDDKVFYPDLKNAYPTDLASIQRERHNATRVLQGSSGTPRDEDGNITGKHLYAALLREVENQVDDNGDPRQPWDFDIALKTSGTGKETQRSFNATGNTDLISWEDCLVFDLQGWVKPWSYDAIRALMAGGETWENLMKSQGFTLYPQLTDNLPF